VIDSNEELDNVFLCSINGSDLLWTVDGVGFPFIGTDPVGEVRRNDLQPGSFAQLLVVADINITVATRLSVLRYEPPPNFTGPVNVTCQAQRFGECTVTVFVGEYYIRFRNSRGGGVCTAGGRGREAGKSPRD
jgi:hypothetical protein